MAKWAIVFGLVLCGLGLAGWMGGQPANSAPTADVANTADAPKASSITALIPAFVGIPLLLCGLAGLQETWRKHAMHLAAAVGLLGFLGAGGRLASKAGAWLSGDPAVNSRAMWFIVAMTIVCLVYVVLSVKSFVDARKARARAS